ncbi:MAG: SGNH/GDSL hydrolase family protein [Candidatus Cryptobacteroides sp.]
MDISKTLAALTLIAAGLSLQAQVRYRDASSLPLYGKASDAMENRYERLPDSLATQVRTDLAELGRNSAGLYLRFRSNSSAIWVRWETLSCSSMPHMADTGVSGLDLYSLTDEGWKYCGTAKPYRNSTTNEKALVRNMQRKDREFMLYLPLYNGIRSISIGTDEDATLEAPLVDSPKSGGRIVFYGTSILQGGCCSRPGMAFTGIIARNLDCETVNLGFSGNGRLDYEVARVMAAIDNPAIFILDNVPNCTPEQIREKGETFFRIIRDAHPDVPVIFIDNPVFGHYNFDEAAREDVDSRNEAQKELFLKLKSSGEKRIYHITNRNTVGTDGEAFVDGIHFTDLGMMRYAEFLTPVIRKRMLKL